MSPSTSTIQARRALLDSSGFLSLFSPHDVHHQAAVAIWSRLTEGRWRTYTTNFLVAETHSLFLVRLGHRSATDFLRGIVQGSTIILPVEPSDEEEARATVFQYDDKDFSLTDATSFTVMERMRVPAAFTVDRHFAQSGFTVLTAQ